jgi:hypothetical protein
MVSILPWISSNDLIELEDYNLVKDFNIARKVTHPATKEMFNVTRK